MIQTILTPDWLARKDLIGIVVVLNYPNDQYSQYVNSGYNWFFVNFDYLPGVHR